jgi:hypothetical protein
MNLLSRLLSKHTPAPSAPPTNVAAAESTGELIASALGADEGKAQVASERLAALIDAGGLEFADFSAQAGNQELIIAVATFCHRPEALTSVLAGISDPAALKELALNAASSRLRRQAAERIDDPNLMRELLKETRHKDKSTYQILDDKLSVLRGKERDAQAHESEVQRVIAALERQARRPYEPAYSATYEHLAGSWRALEVSDEDLLHRAEIASAACREVLAEHQRQIDAREADRAEALAAREAGERARAEAAQAAVVQAQADAQEREVEAAERAKESAARAEKQAAEEQFARQVGGLMRKVRESLQQGDTKKAAGLRRAIEEKCASHPAPAHLAKQLQQLDSQLDELRQWKDFAAAPKRAELIEGMQALIGATLHPQALAERIKTLQEQWRTLSRGIVSESSEDWQRFHEASQTAYQPCKEFFEAQAKRREENLKHRKALLERVTNFEATQTEHPDYKLMATALREAPLEWRRHRDVDRDDNKPVHEAFGAALGRLQKKLDVWQEANVAAKRALIEQARIAQQLGGREATDQLKRLQEQWKNVGPAARDQEQALWTEFRSVCDEVFESRKQAVAEQVAALDAARQRVTELCEEIERSASLTGAELAQAAAKIGEWRTAFGDPAQLPRAQARQLNDRFERALERLEQQIARQRVSDAERIFDELFEAARRIQAYGASISAAGEQGDTAPLKQAAVDFIAGVKQWPKGAQAVAEATLRRADALSAQGGAAREQTLRNLCIRFEILSDTATPNEDMPARRALQLQKLTQGGGQEELRTRQDWDALALEWLKSDAVSAEVFAQLQERFLRCWAKRPVRDPKQPANVPKFSERERDRDPNRDRDDRRPRPMGQKPKSSPGHYRGVVSLARKPR